MPLTKIQKQKILDNLKEKIGKQKAIAFANVSGLKVQDLTKLRREMEKKNCELKVAKKTLIGLALKENKIEVDLKKMQGEIALGFGYKDEIAPFKTLYDFAKNHEQLGILGGVIGEEYLEKEKAVELAKIPAREELLAKMVGSLSAPMSGFVNVLQGNIKGLLRILATAKT
ncbi:MAG: 50S ribosomal protein L10 [Candidatus Nealsonbacteria bacterium]|nr:MAG: 50S ribosomal protein L10 [Candidatus Nealsonbacteria bacterium]